MSEKIELEFIASKNEQSFQTIEQDLKQLEKPRAAEIALNLSRAKTELAELKKLQKEALKVENFDLADKIGQQVEIASKKVTTINRQLTNFQRTGNENLSMLGQMFSNVNQQILNTESVLNKIGKNTVGLAKLKEQASLLKQNLESGNISIEKYKKGLESIGAEADKLLKSIQAKNNAIENFSGMLMKVGGFLGGFSALQSVGASILNLGDKLEQANISFEVMLGSSEKAKKMLADLSKFAQNTPFELQGIRQSAKQLMAMGIPAEKMISTLKVLGDISAGTSAPLEQIAYAYGQVATAGVATTQDMNQLINAGIPIWKELGKVVGKTATEVKKMVENREITFEQVETAMRNMTEAGGQFANLMEAQSKTLTGQWNAFKDSLGAIGEKIGLAVIPAVKKLIEFLNSLIEFLTSGAGKVTILGTAIMGIIAFFPVIIAKFGLIATSVIGGFGAMSVAAKAFIASLGPIGLAIMGITVIGTVIFGVVKHFEDLKKKQEELQYASMTTAEKIEYQKQKLSELNKEYEKGKISADEYKQKLSEINSELDAQKQNLEKVAKFQEEYNKRQEEISKLKSNHDQDGMKSKLKELKKEQEFYNEQLRLEEERFTKKAELLNQDLVKQREYWEEVKAVTKNEEMAILAKEKLDEINQKLADSKQKLIESEGQHRASLQENIAKLQEQQAELQNQLKIEGEKDISLQNLENRIRILNEEQVKLTEQYRTGAISVEEYNQKMAENKAKLEEAEFATGEYKKGLDIVQNEQLGYADKLEMINGLKVSTNQYNALIQKLIQVQNETIKALKLKALLLEQAVPVLDMGGKAVGKIENIVSNSAVGKLTGNLLEKIPGGDAVKNFAKNTYQDVKDATKRVVADAVSPELAKTYALIDEAEKVKKDLEGKLKDIPSGGSSGLGGGRGGRRGGGGGGGSKADQEEKKRLEEIKKKEEELAKIRTNAYKEANKRVEKFSEVVKNSNKKLEEQKKKLEEIKKSAEEVIKDLDEKLVDNQASFEEKIAKRYNDIIKDLKDELKDIGINGLSDEDMIQGVMDGQFSGGEFDKWRQELEIIQEKVDKEKLELAIKNENLTETEKITAEYEKQDALLKNSLELQKAIKEGRFMTNADGGIDFLDENGNILKALDRDQEKEFASEVKKIQDIANEELKIFQEKNEKIGELMKEFEEEKRVLNEEYFEKDKEMRLEQHRMMEEFFAEEISKMEELAYLAGNFGKNFTTGNLFAKKDENIPENSTNTGSASVSSNKSVIESGQKSENIFKNEEKILDDRSQKNAEILQKFHDIVAKIEGEITNTTESEINRRMSLYAQEEARLNTLIAKRIQAGYAIASVPREFQNVNNTTNNSATINVSATSQGNIDANALANTIMRKVQNYQKGIK